MANKNIFLGIDVGGTGLKAALIDVEKGLLVTEKHRELTPQPSKPSAVSKTLKQLVRRFKYSGPIGCGFPAIIHNGVAKSAANIDDEWIGLNVETYLEDAIGSPFFVANDADVAGLAEMQFGRSDETNGLVIVLTIGTGIGSGMFYKGQLIPNTEFGHLLYKDDIYEKYVSNAARKAEDLSWSEWGERFNGYLLHLEKLFSPDLFILGGGASKKFDRFSDNLLLNTKVVPAEFQNDAGVLGAAIYASDQAANK
jgi:polyphosphate glucokinase